MKSTGRLSDGRETFYYGPKRIYRGPWNSNSRGSGVVYYATGVLAILRGRRGEEPREERRRGVAVAALPRGKETGVCNGDAPSGSVIPLPLGLQNRIDNIETVWKAGHVFRCNACRDTERNKTVPPKLNTNFPGCSSIPPDTFPHFLAVPPFLSTFPSRSVPCTLSSFDPMGQAVGRARITRRLTRFLPPGYTRNYAGGNDYKNEQDAPDRILKCPSTGGRNFHNSQRAVDLFFTSGSAFDEVLIVRDWSWILRPSKSGGKDRINYKMPGRDLRSFCNVSGIDSYCIINILMRY